MKLLKHSEKGKSKVKRYKWVSLIALAIFAVTASSTVTAESSQKRIILKVDETGMFVDDAEYSTLIDPEAYATPVMVNNRVLLPIGNIIKEFGGSTSWDAAPKKLTLSLNSNKIVLYLNNKKAFVNGAQTNLDVAPTTISGRTMVPLKFVSDHLGLQLIWDQKNQTIALYQGQFGEIPTDYSEYFIPINSGTGDSNTEDASNTTPAPTPNQNNNKPISKNNLVIKKGDRVKFSFFYGEVKKVDGGRILVYWDSKDNMWVSNADVDYWAMLAGIKYKSSSWSNASELTVER
ncbi:stalk domain-containing protein [Paenibacillus sp. FSL L8-0641]|uniref:stalk domain-containing protein n=1 Tax=Paenibacillus sp. FSL L8-0641 TaxID=2921605 RepID=UPI0030F6E52D